MNTYERIKELSKQKKISIRQLEMKFGYSNGYLAKWKTNTPNSDELIRLADYFNVSTDYMLGRTEEPQDYYFSEASIQSIKKIYDGTDNNYLNLLEKIQQLDEDEIQALSNMAEVMISKKNKN